MNNIRNYTYAVIAVAAGAVAGLGPACAQETGKVMIDVADCIKLDAPETRLACYESRVAAVFGERAARATVRPAAPTPPAAAAVRPSESAPAAGSAPRATSSPAESPALRSSSAPAAADDIVSSVKELREVVPNAWQITLENGQVWRQTVSKHYGLRPGQQVRIYGTRWGNASRLSADEINGYIQVERVR